MISTSESTRPVRVLIAMGTRPEIIKLAPLIWAAKQNSQVEAIVCHSGQHADLAEPMLDYFQLKPDVMLDLMKSHSGLTSLFGGCVTRAGQVFTEHAPDVIVTQGDTATCAAISLAAFIPAYQLSTWKQASDQVTCNRLGPKNSIVASLHYRPIFIAHRQSSLPTHCSAKVWMRRR